MAERMRFNAFSVTWMFCAFAFSGGAETGGTMGLEYTGAAPAAGAGALISLLVLLLIPTTDILVILS